MKKVKIKNKNIIQNNNNYSPRTKNHSVYNKRPKEDFILSISGRKRIYTVKNKNSKQKEKYNINSNLEESNKDLFDNLDMNYKKEFYIMLN